MKYHEPKTNSQTLNIHYFLALSCPYVAALRCWCHCSCLIDATVRVKPPPSQMETIAAKSSRDHHIETTTISFVDQDFIGVNKSQPTKSSQDHPHFATKIVEKYQKLCDIIAIHSSDSTMYSRTPPPSTNSSPLAPSKNVAITPFSTTTK